MTAIKQIVVSLTVPYPPSLSCTETTYWNKADFGTDRRDKRGWCEVVQEVNRGKMCWNVAFFLCQQGRGVAYNRGISHTPSRSGK
jgi:hypothetical protein